MRIRLSSGFLYYVDKPSSEMSYGGNKRSWSNCLTHRWFQTDFIKRWFQAMVSNGVWQTVLRNGDLYGGFIQSFHTKVAYGNLIMVVSISQKTRVFLFLKYHRRFYIFLPKLTKWQWNTAIVNWIEAGTAYPVDRPWSGHVCATNPNLISECV